MGLKYLFNKFGIVPVVCGAKVIGHIKVMHIEKTCIKVFLTFVLYFYLEHVNHLKARDCVEVTSPVDPVMPAASPLHTRLSQLFQHDKCKMYASVIIISV